MLFLLFILACSRYCLVFPLPKQESGFITGIRYQIRSRVSELSQFVNQLAATEKKTRACSKFIIEPVLVSQEASRMVDGTHKKNAA